MSETPRVINPHEKWHATEAELRIASDRQIIEAAASAGVVWEK